MAVWKLKAAFARRAVHELKAFGKTGFVFVCRAVTVLINEEVRVSIGIVGDGGFGDILGVGLHGFHQLIAHAHEFIADGFLYITVTVIVDQGRGHTDFSHVFDGLHAGVAGCALLDFEFQRVRVVAILAFINARNMIEQSIVLLIRILDNHQQPVSHSG